MFSNMSRKLHLFEMRLAEMEFTFKISVATKLCIREMLEFVKKKEVATERFKVTSPASTLRLSASLCVVVSSAWLPPPRPQAYRTEKSP